MFALRCVTGRAFRSSLYRVSRRQASRIAIPFAQPPFPIVATCPAPTCQCRDTPTNLEIDHETNLNGSIGTYAEQLLISTGRSDWKSRIDEDDDAKLLQQLKGLLGRGGKYSDPYHNILLTNSSFTATQPSSSVRAGQSDSTTSAGASQADDTLSARPTSASAYLLPSFRYIPEIPTDTANVEKFVQGFLLPEKLHRMHDVLPTLEQAKLLRQPEQQQSFQNVRDVDEILVLICGHGGRDERCGIYGPLLQAEFEEKLQQHNITVRMDAAVPDADSPAAETDASRRNARVGLISHIGGHKFAGNVIVYVPPSMTDNALAGHGIWYGRVEPKHVEGIVTETILKGVVIKDMFRGGIDRGRNFLRI